MSQSEKTFVSRDADEHRPQMATVQPPENNNLRSSHHTLLLPSPSSAFSPPQAKHVDTVPPTTCQNTDVDVPNTQPTQCRDSPDIEYRYRRRGTVREMAQSYDRATQQSEVSAHRRLSCTFRPTLPPSAMITTNSSAVSSSSFEEPTTTTIETSGNHYTTTSVFSLSKPVAPPAQRDVTTKPQETKLKRLYSSAVTSLYQSLDNLTRLQRPFTRNSNKDMTNDQCALITSKESDLRRSASSQHMTESTPDVHADATSKAETRSFGARSSIATFPLSSRHHSHSIHTLTNLSAKNFRQSVVDPRLENSGRRDDHFSLPGTESKVKRNHSFSSWNVTTPVTSNLSGSRPTSTAIGDNVPAKDTHQSETNSGTKMAEMKVVLDRKVDEPVNTSSSSSRCLTVRQTPPAGNTVITQSVALAFVSPRPMRKIIHHLQPLSPISVSSTRPTSVEPTSTLKSPSTERRISVSKLIHFPEPVTPLTSSTTKPTPVEPLPSVSSQTVRASSSEVLDRFNDAQHLLMKTADMSRSEIAARRDQSSSPCKTLIELVRESHRNVFPRVSPSTTHEASVQQYSDSWTAAQLRNMDLSGKAQEQSRNQFFSRANLSLAARAAVQPVSPLTHRRLTPPVKTEVPSPVSGSRSKFSPSAQPQRAQIAVISPHLSSPPKSTSVTTRYRPRPTSMANIYPNTQRHHHQNSLQTSAETVTPSYFANKLNELKSNKSYSPTSHKRLITVSSSSTSSSAAVVKPSQMNTSLTGSTPHPVTSLALQLGQRSNFRERKMHDESMLTNGFVTAALDSAIELLTLKRPQHNLKVTRGGTVRPTWNNNSLGFGDNVAEVEMTEYDLLDQEPETVAKETPRSEGQKTSQLQIHPVQALQSKAGGSRSIKEELEVIQRRRAFQMQRKDDSFEQPVSPPGEYSNTRSPSPTQSQAHTTITTATVTTLTLPLPRDSVIARHRRRCRATRHVVTSSSSSSRDEMTSSSRDTTPDSSSETRQSSPAIARRAVRRRRRPHDPT